MSNLVYGVGIYSTGKYDSTKDKRQTVVYKAWNDMLRRCYSEKYHAKKPTYIDCDVCCDWLDFQAFAHWYVNHKYFGMSYQLDKDLLSTGNKIYCPDSCTLIPQEINKLLTNSGATRGQYPQGVNYHKRVRRFGANMNKNNKKQHLGYFDTIEDAANAYKAAKEAHVKDIANAYKDVIDIRAYNALMSWQLTT